MAYCMSVLYNINDCNYITSSVSYVQTFPGQPWRLIYKHSQQNNTYLQVPAFDDLGTACFFFSSYFSTIMIKTVFCTSSLRSSLQSYLAGILENISVEGAVDVVQMVCGNTLMSEEFFSTYSSSPAGEINVTSTCEGLKASQGTLLDEGLSRNSF